MVHNTLELIVVKVEDQLHRVIVGTSLVERLKILREVAIVEEGRQRRYLAEGHEAVAIVPPKRSRYGQGPGARVALLVKSIALKCIVGDHGGAGWWRRSRGASGRGHIFEGPVPLDGASASGQALGRSHVW